MQISAPKWLCLWLCLSAALVVWDAGFVLLRPWSLPGGPLATIWKPYAFYGTVDLIYGNMRYEAGDRFCEAQSLCNLLEVAMQLTAVWLLRKSTPKESAQGVLLAFTSQGYTLWKTLLYWLYDILAGGAHTGHNPFHTLVLAYIIPNSLWLIFPALAQVQLGITILRALIKSDKE